MILVSEYSIKSLDLVCKECCQVAVHILLRELYHQSPFSLDTHSSQIGANFFFNVEGIGLHFAKFPLRSFEVKLSNYQDAEGGVIGANQV